MLTMLDKLIVRAANDETFRQDLLSHPDAAISSTEPVLSEDECAVLNEYRRVASQLLAQRMRDAHRAHQDAEVGNAAAGM
jgi:hypothetical protein